MKRPRFRCTQNGGVQKVFLENAKIIAVRHGGWKVSAIHEHKKEYV